MEIITVDWETYYDKEYSLSKLTMEEYIRSPKFEPIMLGVLMPDGRKIVIEGTEEDFRFGLSQIDWSQYAVLAHNTMFDAAILSWRYGVKPKAWLDTLSMARAMFGGRANSLAVLAQRYGLQDKGNEVHNMMGKRRGDMTYDEFTAYQKYCLNDVDLTFKLFTLMSDGWYDLTTFDMRGPYPIRELELIDAHIRMYTEPALILNKDALREHLNDVITAKEKLLNNSGFDKDLLMSNIKFAEVLQSLGVDPPRKISPTTGKEAFAFAKTDAGMKALLEHEDPRVQAVAAARMGVKSTLEETRTQRFINIAERDPKFPVPLRYSAARTHRSGGTDGINMQNLPARGKQGGKLKRCIEAPPGYVLIDCDSSNIEARMLAWLAGQDDLCEDFANGVDVYCKMAGRIYDREITKADKLERFVGKTVVLGAGYQTGKNKLQITLKNADPPMLLSIEECDRIIQTYRNTYSKIPKLWEQGEAAINAMHGNYTMWFGREGVVSVEGKKGILLPSGLYIQYPQLHRAVMKQQDGRMKEQWVYKDTEGLVNIYGGKLTENVVQALARIVVMYQLLKIRKRYQVVLTVHDAVACLAPEAEAKEAQAFVEECMRWVPKWATGCPINCESGIGSNYGEC